METERRASSDFPKGGRVTAEEILGSEDSNKGKTVRTSVKVWKLKTRLRSFVVQKLSEFTRSIGSIRIG